MALRYGYFDSEIIGYDSEGMPILDRAETSELLCLIFANLITNGVLATPNTCFQVIAKERMSLEVQPGFGVINGHFGYDNEVYHVEISEASREYKRIDAVVFRLNNLERKVEIVVKSGTPANNPVPPEIVQTPSGDYYELCLATIEVKANQTVITQSSITDTRLDSSVCGVVTQLIDHLDTEAFYAQIKQSHIEFISKFNDWFSEYTKGWTDDFISWFEILKEQLAEDAAGNLQNQIYSINAVLKEITDDEIDAIIAGRYEEDSEGGMEPDIYSRVTSEEIKNVVASAFGGDES